MRTRVTRLLFIVLGVGVALFGVAVAAALVVPAAPASPAAADAFGMTWQVAAAGGSTMSSGSYTLLSTTGQPVTGLASGGGYTLLHGFWQSFSEAVRTILLPVIIR